LFALVTHVPLLPSSDNRSIIGYWPDSGDALQWGRSQTRACRTGGLNAWNGHKDLSYARQEYGVDPLSALPCSSKLMPCWRMRIIVGTCEDSNSNRTSRLDSKVTGRFENFESPCLPRLPSYHKQNSLFNDKFQSFRHCYWDLY